MLPSKIDKLGVNVDNYNKNPLTFISSYSSTIKIIANGNPITSGLMYRTKKTHFWKHYTLNTLISLSNNLSIQFKNTTSSININSLNYIQFVMSGTLNAYGNIHSLLNYNLNATSYCFYKLFENCTALLTMPLLPATILAPYCYAYMFNGCTNLKLIYNIYDYYYYLNLLATTAELYCYSNMFNGCSNIDGNITIAATTVKANCCREMFYNCTNLTRMPYLPATTLANSCYYSMFNGCSRLKTVNNLPATTLADNCYYAMFENCTSIEQIYQLQATNLANACYQFMYRYCNNLNTSNISLPATLLKQDCYRGMFAFTKISSISINATTLAARSCQYMFQNCTELITILNFNPTTVALYSCYNMFVNCSKLINITNLPATTLAYMCYGNMYDSCTSLTNMSIINATTLAPYCCANMFRNCTALTGITDLLATTLEEACYKAMFYGCINLLNAPELLARTLVTDCYYNMFTNCSKLTRIIVHFLNWNIDNHSTYLWLEGTPNKVFFKPKSLPNEQGNSKIYKAIYIGDSTPITFTANLANSSIGLTSYNPLNTIYYRTSLNDYWKKYTFDEYITLANINDFVQFKNTNLFLSTSSNTIKFEMTGKIKGSGNTQSLLNYSINCYLYCYKRLFNFCYSLITAPDLPAIQLGESCYYEMFSLTNIVDAPILSSLQLAKKCYYGMFKNNFYLTGASLLPAQELAEECYYEMYNNCSVLKKAPIIKARNLASRCCYNMFNNCTSMIIGPTLYSTNLVNLCYVNMFYNCTSLKTISAYFTEWSPNTYNWVKNINTVGTFYGKATLYSGLYGLSTVPTTWRYVYLN